MPNTLAIRRRIKSVRSTRQITKAMELVSATKMRRAQIQALKTRTYALLAWDMLRNLGKKVDVAAHELLRQPAAVKKAAMVLISSNRGLAGTFNNQVVEKAFAYINRLKKEFPEAKVDLIVLGKKGGEAMYKSGQNIIADFQKVDINLKVEDILPIAKILTEKFSSGEYDQVALAYTDFISTLQQKARVKVLLPLSDLSLAAEIGTRDDLGRVSANTEKTAGYEGNGVNFDYLFEPSPDRVLEKLLSRLLEMQLYQAVLESNASEHSARMVSMKNASEAAHDLITDLTLEFNQLRQAAITQEIAEISAGRMAVS